MSTYLVAVVVGLFDYVVDCTSDSKIKHYAHLFCGSTTLVLDSVILHLYTGVKV